MPLTRCINHAMMLPMPAIVQALKPRRGRRKGTSSFCIDHLLFMRFAEKARAYGDRSYVIEKLIDMFVNDEVTILPRFAKEKKQGVVT